MAPTICSLHDCERPIRTMGYCHMHYTRMRRHGDPNYLVADHRSSYGERLAEAVAAVTDAGCVLVRSAGRQGYAYVGTKVAHRLAYELHKGPIPAGLHVDHVCHNDDLSCAGGNDCLHRRCVNPDHLEAVTPATNALRSTVSTAGRNARKTHCKHGHEFTPENTYSDRGTARACKTCTRSRQIARLAVTA